MSDDLPWGTPTPETAITTRTSKHRHVYDVDLGGDPMSCRCGRFQDPDAIKRAKSSIRAGKDAERAIAKLYPDARRTGQYGGPDDVIVGDLFIVQSKAGGWFSERVWAELVKLPRGGGRIPTLVVSDRPGPGHRTRRYVIRTMDDDLDLHGRKA